MVDNCYGEFVEEIEPTQVGADLVAGSLIKNPGGGLAPTGGYIAGRADLVGKRVLQTDCARHRRRVRLHNGAEPPAVPRAFHGSPYHGAGTENGDFLLQGDGKTGICGQPPGGGAALRHHPRPFRSARPTRCAGFVRAFRQALRWIPLSRPNRGICRAYDDQVIMAAGAFVQGASIELSADAPMREPYVCYMQGGLTYSSGKSGHPARR